MEAGQLLLTGAAFPTLFKKLVGAFTKKQLELGDEDEREKPGEVLRAYFAIS